MLSKAPRFPLFSYTEKAHACQVSRGKWISKLANINWIVKLAYNIPRDLHYFFYKITFNKIFVVTDFSSSVPA
jgi:hypothetical protein